MVFIYSLYKFVKWQQFKTGKQSILVIVMTPNDFFIVIQFYRMCYYCNEMPAVQKELLYFVWAFTQFANTPCVMPVLHFRLR